jgi:phage N-6-adenine-methyltransferase
MPRPRIYRSNAAKQAAYRRRKRKRHSVWATPPDLFASLHKEFRFDLDVCALPENAKCARYFTPKDDGLAQAWSGTVWMNPPRYASGLDFADESTFQTSPESCDNAIVHAFRARAFFQHNQTFGITPNQSAVLLLGAVVYR